MSADKKYSKCGFQCSRCPAYKGNTGSEQEREQGSAIWEKYFGLHLKPSIIKCAGCQSKEPWKSGNILPERGCSIRTCAVYNNVPTCAHCLIFPCHEYLRKTPGADLKEKREQASGVRFTDREYEEYLEPYEGQTHLQELRASLKPEEIIAPAPFPMEAKTVPFPSEINLPKDQQSSFRDLYGILSRIFNPPADNYIDHVLMERKKQYLYGIIWAVGRYGRPDNDKLVLNSSLSASFKECSRLVRKTDNHLHGAIHEAVEYLRPYGLIFEFLSHKKDWELTLQFDQNAGGPGALLALQTYIYRLTQKYGEAVYVNSFNLKGKAFRLFTSVDMRNV